MSKNAKSVASLLVIRFVLTIVLVWAMTTYLDQYFYVGGGWKAYVIVAALITLLNFTLRPLVNIILLPLKFFATFLAVIAANVFFLWVVREIALKFDPSVVTIDIRGFMGWVVAAAAFGIANWILTH